MVRFVRDNKQLWRWLQIGAMVSLFGFALSSGLAACGKKSSDSETNLNVGSLTSDGYAVSSNTTVGGYPLSLVISNIQPAGTGYVNNQCGYNTNGQYVCNQPQQNCGYNTNGQYVCNSIGSYSNLIFTIQVNGQSQQLSTTMSYNNTYTQRNQAQVGGFQVLYQAACYTSDCAEVLLEVIVGGSYDYRQIGIRRSNAQNKIIKLGEWQASWNSLRSIQQIMTEM